jgi:hypothetical protein
VRTGRVFTAVALGAVLVSSAAAGTTGSSFRMRLAPEHPAPGTTATLRFSGTTSTTAQIVVVSSSAASCPARVSTTANAVAPRDGLWTGGIAGGLRVHVDASTKRFCGYLVPATQDAFGNTQYDVTAKPLATAQAEVAGALRVTRIDHVLGGGGTLLVTFNRAGTVATRLQVVCGGNPLHPPRLGKEFIGKRFHAKVSIPLAPRMRWAGGIAADNSSNYDAPIPAKWTRPVRFSMDVRVVYVGGSPGRLAGTGTLTSPGLPCPTVRHFH